jgi:hypothetical protein
LSTLGQDVHLRLFFLSLALLIHLLRTSIKITTSIACIASTDEKAKMDIDEFFASTTPVHTFFSPILTMLS